MNRLIRLLSSLLLALLGYGPLLAANLTGGATTRIVASACTSPDTCNALSPLFCRSGNNLYICDVSGGSYVLVDFGPANARIVNICSSGCEYTSLNAACAGETSTGADPIIYAVHAGVYTTVTNCAGEVNATIRCDGPTTTVFDVPGLTGDDTNSGCINMGTSKGYTIEGCGFKRCHRGIYANMSGAAAGDHTITIRGNSFETENAGTSPNVCLAEDCTLFRNAPDGSIATIIHEDNFCRTCSDGFTLIENAKNVRWIMAPNRLVNHPSGNHADSGMVSMFGIPCYFSAIGDQMRVEAGRTDANTGLIGYRFAGEQAGSPTAGSCPSGAIATISGADIDIKNTTAGGSFSGYVAGISVRANAEELSELNLNGVRIKTSTVDTNATSLVKGVDLVNSTTVVNFISGRSRATGAVTPANNLDLDGVAANQIRVGSVDYVTDDGTVVKSIDYGFINVLDTLSVSTPLLSQNPEILLDNTNEGAGSDFGSPKVEWCNATNAAGDHCTTLQQEGDGVWRLRDDANAARLEIDRFGTSNLFFGFNALFSNGDFLFNSATQALTGPGTITLGLGGASDAFALNWNTATTDASLTWNDTNNRMELGGAEVFRLAGVTTAATLNTAGDFTIDTSANQWAYYSGGAVRVLSPLLMETLFVVSPTTTTDPVWFKAPWPITVSNIDCIVDPEGTAESAVITVRECDANGDSCAGLDGATTITCGNTNTADDGALSNATIDAGDWVDIDTGTVTGTVTRLSITIRYTQDRQ